MRPARNSLRNAPARGIAALRLARPRLLASTALQAGFALAIALPAAAQPAPNARPQGGTVVAGQASISRQPGATVIQQSSDRAAIDWRSFDIGRDQAVQFQQPAASSMTLNRVTGPNPSQIAGRIQANGGVVVINGAGIVVHQGARIDAQTFVASTADTTNAAFMAGRMQFDRPGRPGARIENRGEITVREAGLAALVAPSVANSGTIRARLGTVVLAGAETHTLDMHGDGLVSFDVTGQVRSLPPGADGAAVQALVTNTGTVVADGGTVLMTARAADGVVQQLVSAGGTIRADSVGSRTGSIEIAGVGGAIRVHGTVAAEGRNAGEHGGTIVVNGPGEVTLGDTARVVASGQAGGGTVALGATAARARAQGGGVPSTSAGRVTVAAGARVEADATGQGNGGTIAMLSRARTELAGKVSARGGPKAGDGGQVEVSSDHALALTGTVDTMAPQGRVGTLLIDPTNLSIVATADGTDATISTAQVNTLLGANNLRLEATNDIFVKAAVSFSTNSNSLTLAAGNNVTVSDTITLKGAVNLLASETAVVGRVETGVVNVNAAVTSTEGAVVLRSFGTKDAAGVAFGSTGAATAATTLSVVGNTVTLPSAANRLTAPTVEIAPQTARAVNIGTGASGGLALPSLAAISGGNTLRIGGALGATTATNLNLVGNVALTNTTLDLRATGAVEQTGGTLTGVRELRGSAGTGFALAANRNGIGKLGEITAPGGAIDLRVAGDVAITGTLTGAAVTVDTAGALTVSSTVTTPGALVLAGDTLTVKAAVSGDTVNLTATSTAADALTLEAPVTGAARVSIAADSFKQGGNLLTATDAGGVVELAPNSTGTTQEVTAYPLVSASRLRLGAVTRPGGFTPTTTAGTLVVKAATPGGIDALDLRAVGSVSQTVALDLTGITLVGRAGSVLLDNANNEIERVGGLAASTGDLTLDTKLALGVTGLVSADGTATLRSGGTLTVKASGEVQGAAIALKGGAGGILFDGEAHATGTLTLTTSGAVGGTGQISAGTLKGNVGSLLLGTDPATRPEIANLAAITAQAGLDITLGGSAVTISGPVMAGQGSSANLSINAAAGTLTLAAGGSARAGAAGGTRGGNATLQAAGDVTLAGVVVAHEALVGGAVTIGSGAGIAQTGGSVTAATTLTLNAVDGVTQTGGFMDAPTLAATLTGEGASLGLSQANRFDALGAITVPGSITIANDIALQVTGQVRAGQEPPGAATPVAPAEIAITAEGALTVSGELTAGQAGTPAVGGRISLTSQDGRLRDGTPSAASITITPSATLAALRRDTSSGRIAMTAESAVVFGGTITVQQDLSVPQFGDFALTADRVVVGGGAFGIGALRTNRGRISIRTSELVLEGAPAGGFNLVAPDGTVTIAPRAAGATVSLGGGSGDLAIGSTTIARISADGGSSTGVVEFGRTDGGDMTIAGPVTLIPAPRVRLLSGGDLVATAGGVLTLNRLDAQIGGAIRLNNPGGPHAVNALGTITAGGDIAYRGGGALKISGAIEGGDLVSLIAGPDLTLGIISGGSVTAANGGTVRLQADAVAFAGAVSAPDGRIEILPVTSGQQITLGGGGGLSLLQTDVSRLDAATLLLGAAEGGATTGGNVVVAGQVDFTGRVDRLRLEVNGNVSDPDLGLPRGITVARLGDATAGIGVHAASLTLASPLNAIGALDSFATTNGFSLTSSVPLTLAGPLTAGRNATVVTSAAGATALTVTGRVAAGTSGLAASGLGGDVLLRASAGGLSIEGSGSVIARRSVDTLFGGSVQVSGAQTGTGLTRLAAGRSIVADRDATFSGGDGVMIAGSIKAAREVVVNASASAPDPALTLTSTGVLESTAGSVRLSANRLATLDGAVTALGGNLVLNAAAVEGGGPVRVLAVTGSATRLDLEGAANNIGALSALSIGAGGLSVDSLDPLAVQGVVSSSGAVRLDAPRITIAAGSELLAAGQDVTLLAGQEILADGRVVAGLLTGTSGTGAASFGNAANDVARLGDFTAGAGFTLVDGAALTVQGDVGTTAGTLRIVSHAAVPAAVTLGGDLIADAGTVVVQATAGGITQSTGTLRGQQVDLTAAGAVTQTAGMVKSNAFDIVVSGASFDIAGTLEAARDISLTATGGPGTLGGSATAGRDVVINVTGGLLALSGTQDATGGVIATASGGITQAGTLGADGAVTLTATGGDIVVDGGLTALGGAATLTASAGAVTLNAGVQGTSVGVSAAGAVMQTAGTVEATMGDVVVTGGSFDLAGTLDAAQDLRLTSTAGPGTLGGTATAGRDLSINVTGGQLALSGMQDATGDFRATASGGITQVGTLGADGAVTLTATGGDVALSGGVTGLGTVTVTAQAGGATLTGTVQGSGVEIGATGAVSQTAGLLKATAGDVVVTGGSFDLVGTLDAAQDLRVTSTAGPGTLGGTATAGRDIVIGVTGGLLALSGTQDATGNAIATASGGITQAGTLGADGAVTLTATGGDIVVDGGVTALGGAATLTASAGAVTLNAGVQGTAVGVSAAGAVTQTAGTVEATTADVVVSGASFDIAGTLDAARDISLTATGGPGTLGGSATAGRDVVINVTGGLLALSGMQDATGVLAATSSGGITQAGTLGADGAVTLTATGGDIALSGGVTALSTVTVTAQAGGATLTGTVQGSGVEVGATGTVSQTAGLLKATARDVVVTGGSFDLVGTLDAAQDLRLTSTAGPGTLGGTATAGRDIVIGVTGGLLALSGTQDATGNAIATASGGITQAGTLGADGAVALTATGGSITINGGITALAAATLTAQAGGVTVGAGIQGSRIAIEAAGAVSQTAGLLKSMTGDIVVTGASFDLAGTLDAARDISLTATSGPGTLQASSATAGRDVLIGVTGGSLALSGMQDAGNSVTATSDGGITQAGTLRADNAVALTATGGDVAVNGAVTAVAGAVALAADTGSVTLAGTVKAGDAATVVAGADIVQASGLVEAASLQATAGGAALQDGGTLDIAGGATFAALGGPGRLGGTVQAGGALTVAATGLLTLDGTIQAGGGSSFAGDAGIVQSNALTVAGALALGATAGGVTLGGTVQAGATTVQAGGAIEIPGSLLASGPLDLQAGGALDATGIVQATALTGSIGGDAALTGANRIATLGTLDVGGALTLNNAQPLAVTGQVTAGGTLALDINGALTLNNPGGNALVAPTIILEASSITQIAGTVVADALDARATGAVALGLAGNQVTGLAGAAGGEFALATSTALALTGPVTAGGALRLTAGGAFSAGAGTALTAGTTLTLGASAIQLAAPVQGADLALTATGGGIQQSGGSIAWTGTATLNAAGALSQTGGALLGGPNALLAGSAGGAVSLAGSGNRIPRLGPLAAGNGITLFSLGDVAVVGGLAAGNGALLLTTGGNLAFGAVPVSAPTASITAGAALSQQAGGSIATSGALTLTSGTDMTLNGTISGNPVRLNAGRNLAQAATGSLSTGTLTLAVGGSASLLGNLAASLVTGSTGGALTIDGPVTSIATLQDIAAGGALVIRVDGPLLVQGRMSTPSAIVASTGPMTIGTLQLATGGVPYVEPPPGAVLIDRLPTPIPGTPGAVFETGAPTFVIQPGTLTVTPISGQNATLALRLPASGGRMTIGDLEAPTTDVTLDLGTGGFASGLINVRNLTVLGAGGSAELEGFVRGFDGSTAASVAAIGPQMQSNYTINDCPVGSVNCVLLLVQIPVVTDPLRELGVIPTRDDRDDPDVFMPNVAERDF